MIARAFALLVAGPFRFLIIAAGIFVCAAVYVSLPQLNESQSTPMTVTPSGSKAESAERRAIAAFGFPLVSEIVVVQRDPGGLSKSAVNRALDRSKAVDQHQQGSEFRDVESAIPVVNAKGVVPGSKEDGTTLVTLLQLNPNLDLYHQYQLAQRYAHRQAGGPDDHLIGVTGAIPARAVQGDLIDQALPFVEVASVLLIFFLITIRFRAPGAGIVTLVAAGVAYFISSRVVCWAAVHYGLGIPIELEPLLVVLSLAVTTDYAVFLLAGSRAELENGERPSVASQLATARFAPIIVIAALTVAGSAASLGLANLQFLRVLGPALGVSVLISAVVAMTLVPAMISSFGRWILWPGLRWGSLAVPTSSAPTADPGWIRRAIARLQSIRLAAFGLTGLTVIVLVFAATGVTRLHVGISVLDDIPRNTSESRAAQAAAAGFAAGIVSPSDLYIEQPGIGDRRDQLSRLEDEVAHEPGVAGVVGPREQVPGMPEGVFVARDGSAARIVIILRDDPFSARAIESIRHLDNDLPRLLRDAGLPGASAAVAGDTAAGADTINALYASIPPVALAIGVITFALMALLLRALIAPAYLLVASGLSAAAPLGLMAYLFTALGHPDVSYYVPIGVAVLMVSLGADYNLFLVGRIWDELENHTVGGAIRSAAPHSARSISTAALALSLSFASLAIVPLVSFRAFAFAMASGALIDSYVVRGQLVPAMVSLFGRAGAWPGSAFRAATGRRYWPT